MAADPPVSDRVYHEIRRRLLAGDYRLHARLDVGALADGLGASSTPVREALVRLAAERLITARPSRGFFVSLWSESELRALYEWRAWLAAGALATHADAVPVAKDAIANDAVVDVPAAGALVAGGAATGVEANSGYPLRVAAILQSVEGRANPELRRAGVNADDRLHAARRAEAELFGDVDRELDDLAARLRQGAASSLRAALRRYHGRRVKAAKLLRERAVLRALGGNGD
ncbi:MAG: GntR family transcriptional regulator [Hyphomonadaceae bacterium]|nr:GntR family transcriptional regulator [Hyphomonadaceae bacterium]